MSGCNTAFAGMTTDKTAQKKPDRWDTWARSGLNLKKHLNLPYVEKYLYLKLGESIGSTPVSWNHAACSRHV